MVGTISNTLNNFDKVTGVSSVSGEHTRRSDSGDLRLVIDELCKSNVFENIPERKHRSFPSTQKKFNSWMTENFKKLHARTNFNK